MVDFLQDDMDFSAYMQETEVKATVLPASSWRQGLKDSVRLKNRENLVFLPWAKVNPFFDFRGGEVTIWAGQNGHGKSQVTDMVKLSLMGQGQKVGNASFEMKPVTNLRRMTRMTFATNPFDPRYQNPQGFQKLDSMFDDFCDWTDGRLWVYNQTGTTVGAKVIAFVRYCAKELGLHHIFVDNLAKCIKHEDDYNGQKHFIDTMCAIAGDYGVHIHVVHHLKKPEKETDRPDKGDVKGSGSIIDQPDNLMLVWRNKAKEDAMKEGRLGKENEPDAMVYCRKQRNYEGDQDNEPSISLWMHKQSLQFLGAQGDAPIDLMRYPHRNNPCAQTRSTT